MEVEFAWTVGEGVTEPVPFGPVVMEAELELALALAFVAAEPAVWTGVLALALAFALFALLALLFAFAGDGHPLLSGRSMYVPVFCRLNKASMPGTTNLLSNVGGHGQAWAHWEMAMRETSWLHRMMTSRANGVESG
jgi:hypothetical protein